MKLLVVSALLGLTGGVTAPAQDKTTYADHVLPLIENHCGKCHNPDKKKGDLDLTTYAGVLKGGGSGMVVVAGNPDSSRLWKAITQIEEPTMPPNKPPLPDKELAVFQKWIAGGLLETSGSKAIAVSKPGVDLSVKISSIGKPEGPPPMPAELPLDPVIHTIHGNPINGLAASPWAPLLAIAGQKQILLYHTTSLELLGILPFDEGQPWDLKFSRSGQLLLAGGGHGAKSGKVILWKIETGERIASLGHEFDIVMAADLSPDQTRVALGGPDRLIKIYSIKTGELEHKIKKHTDWVTALAFSPDGEFLVSGDRNGGVNLWDPENGEELFTTAGHKGAVTAVTWRGDSKVVASSSEDGSVKIWETGAGKLAKTWTAHPAGVLCVFYAHDGHLVTSGRDGVVTSWSADGSKLRSFNFGGEPALRCVSTHDDALIIAANFAGHVAVWNAKDGKRTGDLDPNPLPLAERLDAARQKLREISREGSRPPPQAALVEANLVKSSNEVVVARSAADRAQTEFSAKAKEVVRLKGLVGGANPAGDVAELLKAARAAREKVRATLTNAVTTLQEKEKQLSIAEERLKEFTKAHDPEAERAALQAMVNRLTIAQSQSNLRRARDSVASQKRNLERCQAFLTAKRDEIQSLTKDLATASGSIAKSKLKAALKTATADAKSAEADLQQAAASLAAAQAR